MKSITACVFAEDRFSVPPNCKGSNWGYLVTSEGIVMMDTPMVPRTAMKCQGEIAQKGKILYTVNTHHHVDHITGNFFFPGPVISHEAVREAFFADLPTVSGSERVEEAMEIGQGTLGYIRLLVGEHDAESLPILDQENYQIKPPSITFSERLVLHVGNRRVDLIHLPGHTDGHLGIYLPEEKVFFAGDNFCNGTQPSMAHSLPRQWVASLKQVEAMDIELVVPGHGEICNIKEVQKFREFIETCIDMTMSAIDQGMTKDEAADRISFEALYPGHRCGAAVHPGAAMQRRNVVRLYDMLSKPNGSD